MIRIYSIKEYVKWDEIIASYPNRDVYYTRGYQKAFELNGDGVPILMEWRGSNDTNAICVLMLRDISCDCRFGDKIPKDSLFDATTPYGYGGFIFNRDLGKEELIAVGEELRSDLQQWGLENNIVSIVMRLHPVLNNAWEAESFMDVLHLGRTITMDLDSEEIINANIISKNRNMIRKAEKSGVVIRHGKGMELLDIFKVIYEETMQRDHALDYYYFTREFYESINEDLKENHEIFYAVHDGKIISMAIMIYAGSCLNYHLSGSLTEFRNLAAGNLLLRDAAIWGYQNGFKTFHLGGGVGAGEDSLYKFKAAFNRNSDTEFALGRLILNEERYNQLVEIRKSHTDFDENSKFFPLYRS